MMDCLLEGWQEIHRELFCRENGKAVISLSTLRQKHGPGLKRTGAVFKWNKGRANRPIIAGWRSVIMNYFILLGQQVEAEKEKGKTHKGKV